MTHTENKPKIGMIVLLGIAVLYFLMSLTNLWTSDHGVFAFMLLVVCGVILLVAVSATKEKFVTSIASLLSIIVCFWMITSVGNSDEEKRIAKENRVKAELVAKQEAAAKEAAMTPEERKQRDFERQRSVRGYMLAEMIKASAFDPDALKIKAAEHYKDGVCVQANGKNRFGAYVGWQEYCYLINAKDEWYYRGP